MKTIPADIKYLKTRCTAQFSILKTEHYGTSDLERDFGSLTFGMSLFSYRKGEGLSQKEFAKMIGISPQSLCDLEKERRIPTPGRAAKIARKLKEPEAFWVQLALRDLLRREKINFEVYVA